MQHMVRWSLILGFALFLEVYGEQSALAGLAYDMNHFVAAKPPVLTQSMQIAGANPEMTDKQTAQQKLDRMKQTNDEIRAQAQQSLESLEQFEKAEEKATFLCIGIFVGIVICVGYRLIKGRKA